jgi:hypothetical protein
VQGGAAFGGWDEYDDGGGLSERGSLARGPIGRSPARSNLQRRIKLEHRRCNRIEGRT